MKYWMKFAVYYFHILIRGVANDKSSKNNHILSMKNQF